MIWFILVKGCPLLQSGILDTEKKNRGKNTFFHDIINTMKKKNLLSKASAQQMSIFKSKNS